MKKSPPLLKKTSLKKIHSAETQVDPSWSEEASENDCKKCITNLSIAAWLPKK